MKKMVFERSVTNEMFVNVVMRIKQSWWKRNAKACQRRQTQAITNIIKILHTISREERRLSFHTVICWSGRTSGGHMSAAGGRLLVRSAVHSQLPHVLVRVEDYYIDLWRKQTEQSHVCRQRNRYAKGCNLDLKYALM